jgi:hypothetical protein
MRIKNPARCPAKTCCGFILPGSRFPRVREPITKSCVPLIIGSTNAGIKRGTSLPSPSRKTIKSHSGEIAATPAAQARPYPRGAETTRAPSFLARSAVWSVLPLSTTMTSRGVLVAITSRTTSAIGSSSLSAGMTTEIHTSKT